jgi:hypothetical protein
LSLQEGEDDDEVLPPEDDDFVEDDVVGGIRGAETGVLNSSFDVGLGMLDLGDDEDDVDTWAGCGCGAEYELLVEEVDDPSGPGYKSVNPRNRNMANPPINITATMIGTAILRNRTRFSCDDSDRFCGLTYKRSVSLKSSSSPPFSASDCFTDFVVAAAASTDP